jgi:DNA-binding CsgD family transcriptional regulator
VGGRIRRPAYTLSRVNDARPFRRWFGRHAEGVLAARGDPGRLATVFARSAVPMVLTDGDRRYIEANQLARDALGLSYDQLRQMRMDDVTPPYLIGELKESWDRLLETGVLIGDNVSAERRYVAMPWYSIANVLPGRHVVVFVPHTVTPDDLPQDGYDTAPPGVTLTPRELEVLELAANGLNGPRIAKRLKLSTATVKTHFANIYRKLDAPDRAAAMAKAMRLGLMR